MTLTLNTTMTSLNQYVSTNKLPEKSNVFTFFSIEKPDSSSLTNEKDHHYFLNSADVCW